MANQEEVTDPDNPEWTEEKFARSIKFKDLPASLQRTLSKPKRGPQKAPTKMLVSMRLSRDVVAALRATGDGWQVRADEALRQKFAKGRESKPLGSSPLFFLAYETSR